MGRSDDARDLGGRLVRLLLAVVLGIPSAIAILVLIPHGARGMWFPQLALLTAGAVGMSLLWHAVLCALVRPARAPRLPRAHLVRR
jgi:hypothetical protein